MRRKQRTLFGGDDSATNAKLEQDSGPATFPAGAACAFTAPVHIAFHHIRKRLADIDNLSGKAAIDGLVAAGILATDSPKQVASVTHSQAQGEPERTIITIREASPDG